MNKSPFWGELPALVLTEIYGYLNFHDRLNASSTCWHWRYTLFQPRFFKSVHFNISRQNDKKNHFFLENLSNLVKEIKITFDYLNLYDTTVTTKLLQHVCNSSCLISLILRPKSFKMVTADSCVYYDESDYIYQYFIEPIIVLLSRRQPSFKKLDLGGCEQLSQYSSDFLNCASKPQDLMVLGLATVKQDPSTYPIINLENNLFEKCTSLQILSIDYDIMCDEYLKTFELLPLKKLIIHVHGVNAQHPGITENAWISFRENNPVAEVYLTLIYAYEAVYDLHNKILRKHMPLSHLKVLFCEWINIEALEYLSQYYEKTLKSIIWVDSGSIPALERNDMDLYLMTEQDPLVMMAWKCHKLYEIIIHGYALDPHNLVGIARLRGHNLKKLEVSMKDLTPSSTMLPSFIEEISTQLGQKWSPLSELNVHPAINSWNVNCVYIRNKYILDMVRSDMNE